MPQLFPLTWPPAARPWFAAAGVTTVLAVGYQGMQLHQAAEALRQTSAAPDAAAASTTRTSATATPATARAASTQLTPHYNDLADLAARAGLTLLSYDASPTPGDTPTQPPKTEVALQARAAYPAFTRFLAELTATYPGVTVLTLSLGRDARSAESGQRNGGLPVTAPELQGTIQLRVLGRPEAFAPQEPTR